MTEQKKEGAALCPASAPDAKNKNSYESNIVQQPEISKLDAAHFLRLVVGEEPVTFQTFDDSKERRRYLANIYHGTLEDHFPVLQEYNERGAGVFFTVNVTDLQGRATENITKIRAVFVDLDGAALQPVLLAPLRPHVIVESSPGRYHAYWLIDGLPLERFSAIQKTLIKRFEADPVVFDLPRVMRLPGFLHLKGEPILVRMYEHIDRVPYDSEEFTRAFEIDLKASEESAGPELGALHDPLLAELKKRGMVKRAVPNRSGAWEIRCPSADLHTTGEPPVSAYLSHLVKQKEF